MEENKSQTEEQTVANETAGDSLSQALGLTDEQIEFTQNKTLEFAKPGGKIATCIENLQNAINEQYPNETETQKARLLAVATLALGKAIAAMSNPLGSLMAMLSDRG